MTVSTQPLRSGTVGYGAEEEHHEGENSSGTMTSTAYADQNSGSSLLPMLVGGLVTIVLGMIAVAFLT